MIPYRPEHIETMKARFQAAIEDLMERGDDPRATGDAHRFDFDDGYRLFISRDCVKEGEFVVVCGGPVFQRLPVTMVAARVALNFAEITDGRYGQGEVTHVDGSLVTMAYRIDGG